MEYLEREKSTLHRDLKPDNIFIDSSDCVIVGDFGLSKTITYSQSMAISDVGTLTYCSPERIKDLEYDSKAEVWAVGTILYELIFGVQCFKRIKDIENGIYTIPSNFKEF